MQKLCENISSAHTSVSAPLQNKSPDCLAAIGGRTTILRVEIQIFFFRRGDNLRTGFLQHQHLFALRVHRLALRGQAEICLRAGLLDALRNPADGLNVVRAARHRHPPEHVIALGQRAVSESLPHQAHSLAVVAVGMVKRIQIEGRNEIGRASCRERV